MLPLLGLLLVVVAASTYKPRAGGSTPGGAPGPSPAPGAGGIPGRTPAGGIPGGAGPRPATGSPAGGPITAPGGTLPSGRTYDSSVCFTGIPNVVADSDISGLPPETRPLYQAALDMKPESGIYNMTRDFIVGYITNLATCIEARGYTVGAQRLYQRAAEIASGIHDGPGGVPYSTPVLPPPVSSSPTGAAGATTFTDVNGNAWTAQPSATGGFIITTSAYGGKTLEVASLAEAQSVANSLATGPAAISPGGGMIQQPLGRPPLTYTPGGNGMIQQPLAPGGGGIMPGAILRPTGPFTAPIYVDAFRDPIARAVMAIPDVPEGSGLRSEIAKILRIYDSWKAPLTSFPFGDPEWLRARADAIESAYGARQAAKRLRDIAAAVEADAARVAIEDAAGRQEARIATEWPGLSSITDPTLRNTALAFARAFHKTTEVVEGQCEGGLTASGCEMDYPVTVLVPVSGIPAPALSAIEVLLTAMDTLYPTAYPDAKRELRSIIGAIRAGRVRGTFTD